MQSQVAESGFAPKTPQDVLALLGRWEGDPEADRIMTAARALIDGNKSAKDALRQQCQKIRSWRLRQGTVAEMHYKYSTCSKRHRKNKQLKTRVL